MYVCWATCLLRLLCHVLAGRFCCSRQQAMQNRPAAQLLDSMLSDRKRSWSCCPKHQSQCKPGMLCTSSMPCCKEKLSLHKPAAQLIGMSALPGQCTDGLRSAAGRSTVGAGGLAAEEVKAMTSMVVMFPARGRISPQHVRLPACIMQSI